MEQSDNTRRRVIAYNPYRGGNKGSISSLPLTDYDKSIGYPWLHEAILQIRGEKPIKGVDANDQKAVAKAQANVKRQLPFRCAHYYHFIDNKRRQDHIDPQSFLFQTTVDVDEKELVEKALDMARKLDAEEGMWHGMLLHLEYSARKKLHIDIRMPLGMTIEETQRAYCQALGVPCDESCFSPERIIFITDAESEIYRSPMWYAILPDEELAQRRKAFLDRGLSIDGRGVSEARITRITRSQPAVTGSEVPKSLENEKTEESVPDAQPSEKNLIAFDLFREAAGLKNVAIDAQGSRHSSLLAILSAGASRVMTEDEMKRVLVVKMPIYGTEPNCLQLVHDFYQKYGDTSKPMSHNVMRVNAKAEKLSKLGAGSEKLGVGGEEMEVLPPPMPEHLPKLIELLVSRTPDVYKPAVAHAVFPPLATHLWRTRFRYIDNVEHEATLMCTLMAGTGAGKNCVQMPINLIMADIRERDRENLKREKEWKDEMLRKGANKDKRKRPQNLIIQEIDADMTNPAFVMRTAEAQEHFLYTTLNEIDQFDALKGIGNQQFRIMCLAFDPGNLYGQTRVGMQSVTERVTIRFNWNASTTINKGKRYFAHVLTDGPLSRINFCTIPEREIGAEMPVYGTYDEQFKENLKPYIDNLCLATGLIECPQAFELAKRLKEENDDFARLSQSRIFENLSFRANVIAYLKACVLYVANGCRWEPEMENFIRWSEQYDLWCKMQFFGEAIEKAEGEGEKSNKRGPANMLQLLPDIFNLQQVTAVRLQNGLGENGTQQMLKNWVHRHYIRRQQGEGEGFSFSSFSYEKLRYRSDGIDLSNES